MFVMIRIGFSGLPVAFAGHAAVHRPHSVHAYPSRSCRHESCSTRFTPNVSDVSRSTVFRAPFGVRSMKNVFTIAKMMWMCFECGTYARKENKRTTWVHHSVRHHSAASNLKIEVLAIADEIGFHSGRATVPAAASAALNRRNEMTIPRMKQSTIVASRIPSCMSFFGRITYRRWRAIPTPIAARTAMTSSARYSGPVSENPATVGVGTRQPGAYACAVISTTLAPRITNAQKMNEWSTPAYHSRATFRWKIPYTTKFFRRVGRWSHRGSFRWPVNKYRSRRYIFRPKIDKEIAWNANGRCRDAKKSRFRRSKTSRPSGRMCAARRRRNARSSSADPRPSAWSKQRIASNRAPAENPGSESRDAEAKWRRLTTAWGTRSVAAAIPISFGSPAVAG